MMPPNSTKQHQKTKHCSLHVSMLTTSSWISLLILLLSPCFTSFGIHWQNTSIKFTPRALPNRLTPPQPSTISDNTLVDIGDNRKRKEPSPACGGAETDKALRSRKVASSVSCSLRDISYKLKSEITNWFWCWWIPPCWTATSRMTAIQIDTRNSAWQHRQKTASSSFSYWKCTCGLVLLLPPTTSSTLSSGLEQTRIIQPFYSANSSTLIRLQLIWLKILSSFTKWAEMLFTLKECVLINILWQANYIHLSLNYQAKSLFKLKLKSKCEKVSSDSITLIQIETHILKSTFTVQEVWNKGIATSYASKSRHSIDNHAAEEGFDLHDEKKSHEALFSCR